MPREGLPPAKMLEKILLVELLQLESKFDLSCRARLMGVSIPTYRKKIKELNVDEEKEINGNQG